MAPRSRGHPALLPLLLLHVAEGRAAAGGAAKRQLAGAAAASDKAYVSCSEQDVLYVIQQSANALTEKFVRAMDDVKLMQQSIIAENKRGEARNVPTRASLTECGGDDWADLGSSCRSTGCPTGSTSRTSTRRSSQFAGYGDPDPNRTNELWYGPVAVNNTYHVFGGTRSIDTDLVFVSPASSIFPWVVDRQKTSFDKDGFYDAAWMVTNGQITSYYPGFNQIWPGHCFGDAVGPDSDTQDAGFFAVNRPDNNPERKQIWTFPYLDLIKGLMISATAPVYFDGVVHGHLFRDEFIASTGVDITLRNTEALMAALKPTPGALPMVFDDDGRLISAPPYVVATIFGENATLTDTSHCPTAGNFPTCSINISRTADWEGLVAAIRAAPRGARLVGPTVAVAPDEGGTATRYLAAFYRWEGRQAPLWNSVVLVPEEELQNAAKVALPPSLEVTLTDPKGTAEASFVMRNEGRVNLTYHLDSVPPWLVVLEPPDRQGTLASGAQVRFVVRFEGFRATAASTETRALSWLVADDDYPDCAFKEEAVIQVTLRLPVHDQKWIIPVLTSMAAFILLVLGVLAARFLYQRRQQLLRFKKERAQHEEEQLATADKAMCGMAFPIHLMVAAAFCKLEHLVEHEVLRELGRLKLLDYIQELTETTYFFLSHQWTSWQLPDHSDRHFQLMQIAVVELATKFEWELNESHVWVDYSCIPQRNAHMQQLAILSLPIYAAYSTVFVIVAPDVEHGNTKELCDVKSYMTRAWCRAEQMSHVVSRGFDQMYCATAPNSIEPVDRHMVRTCLKVFSGELTCCRFKHKGMLKCDKEHLVLPLLGVYAAALRAQKQAMRAQGGDTGAVRNALFAELLLADADLEGDMFPSHFLCETEAGVERRELFGSLVGKMKERVAASEDGEVKVSRQSHMQAFKVAEEVEFGVESDSDPLQREFV